MAKMCEMFPVKRKPGITLETMCCVWQPANVMYVAGQRAMSLLLEEGGTRWAGLSKKKKRKCMSHSQDARRVVISSSSCVCVWSTEGRVHLLCLRICVRVCVEVMCCGVMCVSLGRGSWCTMQACSHTDGEVGGRSNLSYWFFSEMIWLSSSLHWKVRALVVIALGCCLNKCISCSLTIC